jgi:hypothetical protein
MVLFLKHRRTKKIFRSFPHYDMVRDVIFYPVNFLGSLKYYTTLISHYGWRKRRLKDYKKDLTLPTTFTMTRSLIGPWSVWDMRSRKLSNLYKRRSSDG